MLVNNRKEINNSNKMLFKWCSNLLIKENISFNKLNLNFTKTLNDAKLIYNIFILYENWFNYEQELIKKCFLNLENKQIFINNECYNYNLVEFMCLQKNVGKFSILDFCASLGIFIPHYCYHPDLSIAGNCRMCLIQLDGAIKPIASCAITVSNNMIINTQSIFVKKIQEVY